MEKKQIKVYTNFNNDERNEIFFAIKDEFVIKYTDLDNNKMVIDTTNDVIIRSNSDYHMKFLFKDNVIDITVKKMNTKLQKQIKTLLIKKTKKSYLVRYHLLDENEINEYYVNF